MQNRQVIKDPEGAAVRRQHQIKALDLEIVDRRNGQIELEALPARAGVEGDIQTELRAQIEQAFLIWILPHDAAEMIIRNALDD